jgi:hypothetical protein
MGWGGGGVADAEEHVQWGLYCSRNALEKGWGGGSGTLRGFAAPREECGGQSAAQGKLGQLVCDAARAVLKDVLLHESHMGGLVELCALKAGPLMSPGRHEQQGRELGAAGAGAGGNRGGGGKEEVGKGEEAEKGRAGVGGGKSSYHTLVFQVCGFWLGSTCGLGVEGDGARRCLA